MLGQLDFRFQALLPTEVEVIFRTSFVCDNVNKLLDAQVLVQDLLEEEGIEAISEG